MYIKYGGIDSQLLGKILLAQSLHPYMGTLIRQTRKLVITTAAVFAQNTTVSPIHQNSTVLQSAVVFATVERGQRIFS